MKSVSRKHFIRTFGAQLIFLAGCGLRLVEGRQELRFVVERRQELRGILF